MKQLLYANAFFFLFNIVNLSINNNNMADSIVIIPIFALSIKEKTYRGVEQLVARWAHNPKVIGSSPISATK